MSVPVPIALNMRFSRHAKNKARALKLSTSEVGSSMRAGEVVGSDEDENAIVKVFVRGTTVLIVVALDEPDFVITLYSRRK